MPEQSGSTAVETLEPIDHEAIWSSTLNSLEQIMSNPQSLDQKTYIAVYQSVHTFMMVDQPSSGKNRKRESKFERSSDLYGRLDDFLKRHIETVRISVKDLTGDDDALLKLYVDEWNRFSEAARLNSRLFMFLERHWIRREIDENHAVLEIVPLHMQRWKEGMFEPVHASGVVQALLRVTEKSPLSDDREQVVKTTRTSLKTVNVALDDNAKLVLADMAE